MSIDVCPNDEISAPNHPSSYKQCNCNVFFIHALEQRGRASSAEELSELIHI